MNLPLSEALRAQEGLHLAHINANLPRSPEDPIGIEHFGYFAVAGGMDKRHTADVYRQLVSAVGYMRGDYPGDPKLANEFWSYTGEHLMERYIADRQANDGQNRHDTYYSWIGSQPKPKPVKDRNTGLEFVPRSYYPRFNVASMPTGLVTPGRHEVLIVAKSLTAYGRVATEVRQHKKFGHGNFIKLGTEILAATFDRHSMVDGSNFDV